MQSARNVATPLSVKDWCKIFKALGTENYTNSVTFMKQLTLIALSTITYVKSVFPEDSFTTETFAGMKLILLKEKCNNEWAQFVSSSLRDAFDALEKKYLHQLVLCFYEGEHTPENLIEYHMFEYSYSEEGVFMNVKSTGPNRSQQLVKCTFDAVRQQTLSLIKKCIAMMSACEWQGVSSITDINLRLYYNHDAPENYQAPGFKADNGDHLGHTLDEAVVVGRVLTPYHGLVAKSYALGTTHGSNEAIPSQNNPIMSLSEHSEQRSESDTLTEAQLDCPCNNRTDIDDDEAPAAFIRCTYCGNKQHAVCFGVLPARVTSLSAHCCTRCSDADARRCPTDPLLCELTDRRRESYCMYRRTLDWCQQLSEISAGHLIDRFCMSRQNAVRVINLLHTSGVISGPKEHDIKTPLKINRENLEVQVLRSLRVSEETSLADRLLAETLSSQESQPDPVSDVLGPIQNISLQQASNLGRVIPAVPRGADTGDDVMKQYRDVIMARQPSVRLEELPLSGLLATKDKEVVKKGKRKMNDSQEVKVDKRVRSAVIEKKPRR